MEEQEMTRFDEIEQRVLDAILAVESAGRGFGVDGRLLIQFEPAYFARLAKKPVKGGLWQTNRVEGQAAEWAAFNNAFAIDPAAAMMSCSIGLPQIMGAHYARLGYATVGAMWDDFKSGIPAQKAAFERFIKTDARLLAAVRAKDWVKIATIYNGAGFREIAKKYGGETYDVRLKKAYEK